MELLPLALEVQWCTPCSLSKTCWPHPHPSAPGIHLCRSCANGASMWRRSQQVFLVSGSVDPFGRTCLTMCKRLLNGRSPISWSCCQFRREVTVEPRLTWLAGHSDRPSPPSSPSGYRGMLNTSALIFPVPDSDAAAAAAAASSSSSPSENMSSSSSGAPFASSSPSDPSPQDPSSS